MGTPHDKIEVAVPVPVDLRRKRDQVMPEQMNVITVFENQFTQGDFKLREPGTCLLSDACSHNCPLIHPESSVSSDTAVVRFSFPEIRL
jgi:hypothetical protein